MSMENNVLFFDLIYLHFAYSFMQKTQKMLK